jgi:hypothetical protein
VTFIDDYSGGAHLGAAGGRGDAIELLAGMDEDDDPPLRVKITLRVIWVGPSGGPRFWAALQAAVGLRCQGNSFSPFFYFVFCFVFFSISILFEYSFVFADLFTYFNLTELNENV